MPVSKSAKKALKQSAKKRINNDLRRRAMREEVKAYNKLIIAKDAKTAKTSLPKLYKVIDKAAKAGVIKKNTAARKKSRLTKKLKDIS